MRLTLYSIQSGAERKSYPLSYLGHSICGSYKPADKLLNELHHEHPGKWLKAVAHSFMTGLIMTKQ